jgi:hypothetical protein
MPYTEFDAPTKVLVLTALELAWATLGDTHQWPTTRTIHTTNKLTGQLIAAADGGERDCGQLVRAALDGVERAY